MRLKIPRKKYRLPGIFSLILVSLLFVCSSELLADLQNEDHALFWSIQKDGQAAGYLLGTIHSEDPRVLDFSEDFLGKLRNNNVFAMELVPDLPTLSRLTEYMRYPPDHSLESVIGTNRFKALETALSGYGISSEFINRMRPWAAMMTLSTPPPETGFFMDLSLSLRASGSGLSVVGLESLEQQLSFLQNMPKSMQLSLLDQAIAEYSQVSKVHDDMVSAYLENDLLKLQALADEQLQAVGQKESDYFTESGIRLRNHRMAESLLPHLQENKVFVAVGALHLPGEEGLLNLLRRQGFELSPMSMPFSEQTEKSGQ